jgi:hypothetical protein
LNENRKLYRISRSDFFTNMNYCMEHENYAKHEIIGALAPFVKKDIQHKSCKKEVSGISLRSAILLQSCKMVILSLDSIRNGYGATALWIAWPAASARAALQPRILLCIFRIGAWTGALPCHLFGELPVPVFSSHSILIRALRLVFLNMLL